MLCECVCCVVSVCVLCVCVYVCVCECVCVVPVVFYLLNVCVCFFCSAVFLVEGILFPRGVSNHARFMHVFGRILGS